MCCKKIQINCIAKTHTHTHAASTIGANQYRRVSSNVRRSIKINLFQTPGFGRVRSRTGRKSHASKYARRLSPRGRTAAPEMETDSVSHSLARSLSRFMFFFPNGVRACVCACVPLPPIVRAGPVSRVRRVSWLHSGIAVRSIGERASARGLRHLQTLVQVAPFVLQGGFVLLFSPSPRVYSSK